MISYRYRRLRVIRLDIVENRAPILQRPLRPDQLHDLLGMILTARSTQRLPGRSTTGSDRFRRVHRLWPSQPATAMIRP